MGIFVPLPRPAINCWANDGYPYGKRRDVMGCDCLLSANWEIGDPLFALSREKEQAGEAENQ